MCDRIMVLREGRITAELPAAEATQERVLYAMTDAAGAAAGSGAARRPPIRAPSSAPPAGCAGLVVRARAGPARWPWSPSSCRSSIVNPRMLSGANLTRARHGCRPAHDRRRRPDAGHPHPQHRPVGGLGDRPRRLRLGRPAAQPPRARRDRRHPRGLRPSGSPAACSTGSSSPSAACPRSSSRWARSRSIAASPASTPAASRSTPTRCRRPGST